MAELVIKDVDDATLALSIPVRTIPPSPHS